jgi:hypothetical protein
MSCTLISSGISKNCDNNTGGITNIYITDFANVLSLTASAGEISAISMASGTQFYEYQFNKHTSTFAEKTTVSIENGTVFQEQTVTLKLAKRQKASRNNLALLLHKELAVIVKDSNGLFWYVGEVNGANVTDIPSESGTQAGDFNGYTVTILGTEPTAAQEITSSAVTAVI